MFAANPNGITAMFRIPNKTYYPYKPPATFKTLFQDIFKDKSQTKIFVLVDNSNPRAPTYYKVNENKLIGKGTFGHVYPAIQFDPVTHKHINENLCVKKGPKTYIEPDEAELLAHYYQPIKYITTTYSEETFILMPYLGIPISHNCTLATELKKLTFLEKTLLLREIALAYNHIHHSTISTPATVHRDVKPENVLVKININPYTKNKIFNVSPIDFNLADNLSKAITPSENGTDMTKAPENYSDHAITKINASSEKSDIYSLVSIFAMVLGEKNPYIHKIPYKNDPQTAARKDFEVNGIRINLPTFELQTRKSLSNRLQKSILRFLNAMQNQDPESRPTSDEVLKFFVTLNILAANINLFSQGKILFDNIVLAEQKLVAIITVVNSKLQLPITSENTNTAKMNGLTLSPISTNSNSLSFTNISPHSTSSPISIPGSTRKYSFSRK
jgi:serine/threonine protein kinase